MRGSARGDSAGVPVGASPGSGHAEQQVEPQSDGSVILTVHAAHELEIIPRVLALGTDAEILSPASCRKALGTIVEQLSKIYGH